MMARMPLDPRLSRMLIAAHQEGCEADIAVIASALSIQDPRERPSEKSAEADRVHAAFNAPASDFLTLLTIWKRFHQARSEHPSLNALKRFCRDHFLSFRRMREWEDIHAQVTDIMAEFGWRRRRRFRAPDAAPTSARSTARSWRGFCPTSPSRRRRTSSGRPGAGR